MTMPALDLDKSGRTTNVRDLDEVIIAAKHCITGKLCEKGCPYYSKQYGRCNGNWHKDILRWVVFLRNENRALKRERPMTGDVEGATPSAPKDEAQ